MVSLTDNVDISQMERDFLDAHAQKCRIEAKIKFYKLGSREELTTLEQEMREEYHWVKLDAVHEWNRLMEEYKALKERKKKLKKTLQESGKFKICKTCLRKMEKIDLDCVTTGKLCYQCDLDEKWYPF